MTVKLGIPDKSVTVKFVIVGFNIFRELLTINDWTIIDCIQNSKYKKCETIWWFKRKIK